MGRHSYPREHRSAQPISEKDSAAASAQNAAAVEGRARPEDQQLTLAGLDDRISSIQSDLRHALDKVSNKEVEKLELIFSILKELQVKQGQLEETVRVLHTQCGTTGADGCEPPLGPGQPSGPPLGQQPLGPGLGSQRLSSSYRGGGSGNGSANAQAPVQQYQAMMQAGGSQAIFAPVQRMVMVQSPTGMQAGIMQQMQYAVPLQPDGTMQPMAAMQFVGQAPPANAHFCQWAGSEAATPHVAPPPPREEDGGSGPSTSGASS